jgi:penicillin-binding protein 2
VAGKTGTAQGRLSFPWNDSSAFAAYSTDPARPFTVVSYLEKAGFGSTGAAPVVKCMFLALSQHPSVPLEPVQVSETLDTSQNVAAEDLPDVDRGCMSRSDTPTRPAD